MKRMTSAETRETFLDFFAEREHKVVASSSLVPGTDPTLLFTNAGMVQFKDVFLGLDKRPYTRAATSQKCMRISGKHNDLENVGPSPRHHTFFEMLGNFSFGDYFKQEAIRFAFDLLTKVYEIPVEKLYYTTYENDDEAYSIWVDGIRVAPERVHRMGPKTNFWQMADTGPCGPTSEIHYDWGPDACTCDEPDCSVLLDNGCERWLEIWNLVFMQFNRDEQGVDHPLPAPGVDTGMGLERITAIMQGAKTNYDTDLFTDIMDATQHILEHDDTFRQEHYVAYRVIADHTRGASFLIADGVNPGTTGREYVTRMLIRRAWRFAHSMGVNGPFLTQVADAVIDKMGDVYPELHQFREAIHYQISAEEARFIRTLDHSLDVLEDLIDGMITDEQTEMTGKAAFLLYATHGLPFEITRDLLAERDMIVDEAGFRAEMDKHRSLGAGDIGAFTDVSVYQGVLDDLKKAEALGSDGAHYDPYESTQASTRVLAMLSNGEQVFTVETGGRVEVVLAHTPFYVESGGQVSDTGAISAKNWQMRVEDTRIPVGGLPILVGEIVSGTAEVGDQVIAQVDEERRRAIMRNHTATHLLHASLRNVLGEHVQQKGSLVASDRLRFDFTHNSQLTSDEIDTVTQQVNDAILSNYPVEIALKPYKEAIREGAMALFSEKYGEMVRTITVPEDSHRLSYELCGGTHVRQTAEIGLFIITQETASSAGVRRIVAVTGRVAQRLAQERLRILEATAEYLGGIEPTQVKAHVRSLQDELEETRRAASALRQEIAEAEMDALLSSTQVVDGVNVLAAIVDAPDRELLGKMTDWYREQVKSGVIVLSSTHEGKVLLTAAVTPDLVERGLHAGKLLRPIAQLVDGGGGGGNPQFATGGGNDSTRLPEAMQKVPEIVQALLR